MTLIYDLLDKVKKELEKSPLVNMVSFGYIPEVELEKTTLFPLSHISFSDGYSERQVITVNLSIYCLDIVDESKSGSRDLFIGNDNLQDVLNEQFQVMTSIIDSLRRGSLQQNGLFIEEEIVDWEVVMDNMGADIAGYSATIPIKMYNQNLSC